MASEYKPVEGLNAQYAGTVVNVPYKKPKSCGIFLTNDEALILQKLLRGYVVGPAARKVLDKINSVEDQ
jgi:hypothetical protein